MRSVALLAIGSVFAIAAAACSGGADEAPTLSPSTAEVTETDSQQLFEEFPLIKGPLSPEGLQAIFATPDLGLGTNRVGFVLTSPKGLIRTPTATVRSTLLPDDGTAGQTRQTSLAVFRPWPYGTRGLYTTDLTFDTTGRWSIEISAFDPEGITGTTELSFDVGSEASAPAVGSPAVRSRSKTLDNVDRISQLTTGSLQDPDLYALSIEEALDDDLPTVVVMASPAFCTNAVCGPQVEVLTELKDKYKGAANFIHVDFYDNPEEIQGDLDRAVISPTVLEWKLPSTEWSFVIDRAGVITDRFESFATLDELEQALRKVF